MGGLYWKVNNDGADWRCKDCQQLKPASRVIVAEHTETHERQLLCLDCVDEEWLVEAKCLGRL